jgi:hypothetical protein
MGPLRVSTVNSHYFVDPSGKAVLLTGTHTWNTFQDLSQSAPPPAFDFNAYVSFLVAHGHNVTVLWRKDLPTYCNWGAGGTWNGAPWPWLRTGPGNATDGLPKFDLTQFNQGYFDRLRARAVQLRQNGIYAIVQLFDGLQLVNNRCSTDGYPFTGANNVNGITDNGGTSSMDLSVAAITTAQENYVAKVIDTLNDLDNVLWEVSEEAPSTSGPWNDHFIAYIRSYEAGKPLQHPIGYPTLTYPGNDTQLFASAADWIAPTLGGNGGTVAPANNQGKVILNDGDHSYGGMWNYTQQQNRNYAWENFLNGSQFLFMDPYWIYWSASSRNLCQNPSGGVCNGVDTRWENFRLNLGYQLDYARKMNLLQMTPQGSLSSTGWCLANTATAPREYLVYAPSGGTFTVNLSAAAGTLAVEWFDPASGNTSSGGTVAGGATRSFTSPFPNDAVLYLK